MIAMFFIFSAWARSTTRIDGTARAGSWPSDGHRDRAAALHRRLRQVGAAPAVHLAARRDGRPHTGVGPDPRRHDGPAGVFLWCGQPGISRRPDWAPRTCRLGRRDHRVVRRHDRGRAERHQRVLAYSTISQLGYMFLAVGVGAYIAAIFHMVTHAFFKALLFLGSGSVIHGMHDEQDMRRMGGLFDCGPRLVVAQGRHASSRRRVSGDAGARSPHLARVRQRQSGGSPRLSRVGDSFERPRATTSRRSSGCPFRQRRRR